MKTSAKVFSPAKLNIFFAVTGIRSDGYHNVLSANFKINFGDAIMVTLNNKTRDEVATEAEVFNKEHNTILSAVQLFREATKTENYFTIILRKNIPTEAGFGGGSSNAAAVLTAFNDICGDLLSVNELCAIGKKIGADCPFFLHKVPCITQGIGEICSPIDNEFVAALKSYNLIIFKPKFGVNTRTAYSSLRNNFQHLYIDEKVAQEKLKLFQEATIASEKILPLYNTFSEMFFKKHEEFLGLCNKLKAAGGNAMLTGSGSGFFCLSHKSYDINLVEKIIKDLCGSDAFFQRVSVIS